MVSTQIINAVRNYTDDALRAAQKAKILDIHLVQVATFLRMQMVR